MKLTGKKVLVIGLGESGLAMVKWLNREGALVRVADSRACPPNVEALRAVEPAVTLSVGPFVPAVFDDIDLMAISPGVPVSQDAIQAAVRRGVPLVSEIELFVLGVRTYLPQSAIVAITGSNGKTTTTALTAHLLNSAGRHAVACGNISPSALDALMALLDAASPPEPAAVAWVLELSSFQLETTYSLKADAATLLNISEDHLDRHAGMAGYIAAKARVFDGCRAMVLNRDDAVSAGMARGDCPTIRFGLDGPGADADYGVVDGAIWHGAERLIGLDALKIVGLHNAANAMAALALCEAVGVAPASVLPALGAFSGLPHRVEYVDEIHGVSYYDDSKGTNVGATLAAVQGMGRPVAIILGGEGKDQDFSPLRAALARHARAVALIGRDAPLIHQAIEGCSVPTAFLPDLDAAVRWCAAQCQPGDAVLLSPACASFDMFRNYGHRAAVFIESVRALARESA